MSSDTEIFPIVDVGGTVIGRATRSECHSGTKLLHPVVHLHVCDRHGRLLLQRRSPDKDIQPNRWDTSVGGHVDYGESVAEALRREAAEELALYSFEPIALTPYVFESEIERELINPFITIVSDNYPFVFQRSEISEIRFFDKSAIESAITDGNALTPNFVGEYHRLMLPALIEQLLSPAQP